MRRWVLGIRRFSIMPTTVPNRPINGAADAMVASALRRRQPVGDGAAGVFHVGAQVCLGAAWIDIEERRPLASTSPKAEFCSSWATTSGAGMVLRVTPSTSSSNLGGATLLGLRLMKPVDDDGQSQHRTGNKRPDRPASGLYDRKKGHSGKTMPRDYGARKQGVSEGRVEQWRQAKWNRSTTARSASAVRALDGGALCRAVADSLDTHFNPVQVVGEISGFARAPAGIISR